MLALLQYYARLLLLARQHMKRCIRRAGCEPHITLYYHVLYTRVCVSVYIMYLFYICTCTYIYVYIGRRRQSSKKERRSRSESDRAACFAWHTIVRDQWVRERSVHCARVAAFGPPALCPLITLRRRHHRQDTYIFIRQEAVFFSAISVTVFFLFLLLFFFFFSLKKEVMYV